MQNEMAMGLRRINSISLKRKNFKTILQRVVRSKYFTWGLNGLFYFSFENGYENFSEVKDRPEKQGQKKYGNMRN